MKPADITEALKTLGVEVEYLHLDESLPPNTGTTHVWTLHREGPNRPLAQLGAYQAEGQEFVCDKPLDEIISEARERIAAA